MREDRRVLFGLCLEKNNGGWGPISMLRVFGEVDVKSFF
jgi:hypothetical protein